MGKIYIHTPIVISPADMTDRIKINEANCADELVAYLEDNKVQDIDDLEEANDMLEMVDNIMTRFNECHTELKLALGDKYHTAYKGRDKNMSGARRYVREIKTRSKEFRRLARQQTADDKAADRLHAVEMEKQLQQSARDRLQAAEADKVRRQYAADEKLRDREYTTKLATAQKEVEVTISEFSARLAKDDLLRCLNEISERPDLNISELERMKADAMSCCQKFRMASLNLATILGDRYGNEHRENEKNISESAQNKISELTKLIREKRKPGVIWPKKRGKLYMNQKGFWGNRP